MKHVLDDALDRVEKLEQHLETARQKKISLEKTKDEVVRLRLDLNNTKAEKKSIEDKMANLEPRIAVLTTNLEDAQGFSSSLETARSSVSRDMGSLGVGFERLSKDPNLKKSATEQCGLGRGHILQVTTEEAIALCDFIQEVSFP